ncbi:helix-turn-helix transcriptional regulator [Halorussus sp. MSC15.2]|uniref:helix-turn-helix transcriptional regulator n=1 Tax=Halorussus sp. MSC15.2 TaxID=2283638 RepID=UPI0013D3BDFD|nr:helix-turn-helix transcriptional regulator [Halorussus sp. MSC15.2]NEU56736.1 PadR family transcriptional regulator [Halorussus sp. MSC15.2]
MSSTSAGVQFADLHAFERDLLYAVRALERDGDAPKGLAVKDHLEAEYDEEINHSRLYQNLDGLVAHNLLTKGKKDDRTNEYATTDEARALLEARTERRAEQVGLSTNGGETA